MVSPMAASLEGSPTTHQSMRSPPSREHLGHALGAVHRWAFLVARDEERNRALVLRVRCARTLRWRSPSPPARSSYRRRHVRRARRRGPSERRDRYATLPGARWAPRRCARQSRTPDHHCRGSPRSSPRCRSAAARFFRWRPRHGRQPGWSDPAGRRGPGHAVNGRNWRRSAVSASPGWPGWSWPR